MSSESEPTASSGDWALERLSSGLFVPRTPSYSTGFGGTGRFRSHWPDLNFAVAGFDFARLTGPLDCGYFSGMGPRPKQPVVICPRCRRRMATKEYKPMEPKARKAIKFTDSLVEVVYICESCGTEIKRTIREK
jgi:hypothetical protein